jgi:Tfp pilus assembly protein PilF
MEERRGRLVALACRAGDLLLAAGEPEEARPMGEAALRHDPWSSRAIHVVAAAASDLGDLRGLRRAVDRYRTALIDLGLDKADVDDRVADLERGIAGRAAG